SGVLSTVAAGLTMGWYQHVTFSSSTRVKARATWSVVVFVMEALVFVLIGLSLNGVLARLGAAGAVALLPLALLITLALNLARFAWVFTGSSLSRLLARRQRTHEPTSPPGTVLV